MSKEQIMSWDARIAVGFAVAFLAFGFHWILARKGRPTGQDNFTGPPTEPGNLKPLTRRQRQQRTQEVSADSNVSRDPHVQSESSDTPVTLTLRRNRQATDEGTNFPLRPGAIGRPLARRGPLTLALYFWPALSPEHLGIARGEFDRVCAAIRDRLGIQLTLLTPAKGRLVYPDPARLGLVACDPCGAYFHRATDITVVFKALRDSEGQPVAHCGGVTPVDRDSIGEASSFANIDVSFVLAGATTNPEEKLYHVLLHTVLKALSRQPTKHTNPWGGTFLVPSPHSDREYIYPCAYGESPEERARADAEGWQHYNEAILSGTAIRYVPCLDGPRDAAKPSHETAHAL